MSDRNSITAAFRPEIHRRRDLPGPPVSGAQRYGTDAKTLIVGREIDLSGEIAACDKLVVEGQVEAALSDCRQIEIAAGGYFKGTAVVDDARINGIFEGTLTVRNTLVIQSSGAVAGDIRYGELEIERGGRIAGSIHSLDDPVGGGEAATVEELGAAQRE
jgi:cytoskeletal protein CcmA (bactofilin family)